MDIGLRHPSEDVRWASAAAFIWTRPADPESFVRLLADPSAEVVARAVRVLGTYDQTWIQQKLRGHLTDERIPLFFHVLDVIQERAWRSRPSPDLSPSASAVIAANVPQVTASPPETRPQCGGVNHGGTPPRSLRQPSG